MEEFDFEELIADMFDITDEQRNEGEGVREIFYDKFELDYDNAYHFIKAIMPHTPIVRAGVDGEIFHALVDKKKTVMLMKLKVS